MKNHLQNEKQNGKMLYPWEQRLLQGELEQRLLQGEAQQKKKKLNAD